MVTHALLPSLPGDQFLNPTNCHYNGGPGVNDDGRTTRGLDWDDIESETTTKMSAVQWRHLHIRQHCRAVEGAVINKKLEPSGGGRVARKTQ